ncbi:MAG: hydroxymyristoyl-ACP dehydratase [Gammaproteobacteria bacterium]
MRAPAGARLLQHADGKLPDVRSRVCSAACARFELAIPETLAWFIGHFPDHPVLPGVAQVGWAVHFSRETFGLAADPPRIERVKYQRPIRPGETVYLVLSRDAERPARIAWRFERAGRILGSGRLEFAPES